MLQKGGLLMAIRVLDAETGELNQSDGKHASKHV
jgi:hypothetical protein